MSNQADVDRDKVLRWLDHYLEQQTEQEREARRERLLIIAASARPVGAEDVSDALSQVLDAEVVATKVKS